MRLAFRIASRLLLAGSAALVHAAVPCLCKTTAAGIILAMNADIVARARQGEPVARRQRAAVRVRRIHLTSLFSLKHNGWQIPVCRRGGNNS